MPSEGGEAPSVTEQIVISRREPLASVNSGRSISPATMCRSTYLPKVSRICAFDMQLPGHAVEGLRQQPNSSRDVVETTALSAPQARWPTLSRRHPQHLIARP